jgi:hypothetical protein
MKNNEYFELENLVNLDQIPKLRRIGWALRRQRFLMSEGGGIDILSIMKKKEYQD